MAVFCGQHKIQSFPKNFLKLLRVEPESKCKHYNATKINHRQEKFFAKEILSIIWELLISVRKTEIKNKVVFFF